MKYALLLKNLLAGLALAGTLAVASPPPESNRAGDIPDTQAFVTYAGAGYSVLVPEGWARTQRGSVVTFASNANSETIDVRTRKRGIDPRKLAAETGVKSITVPVREQLGGAGTTTRRFRSLSSPDPVTGKRVELDNAAYFSSAHGGRYAILILSGPVGADNVDQWQKIAKSFRWK